MRTAIAVALTLAAPLAAAQEATTPARQPMSITGDFDRDGLPDRVDLTFADGQYTLNAIRGLRPDDPYLIAGGPEDQAGDVLELRNGGTFVAGSSRGRPRPPATFSYDIFIYGKSSGQKFIWSWSVSSFTSMAYLGETSGS